MFEKAVKLWVYDLIIQKLKDDPYDNTIWKQVTAAAITGVAQVSSSSVFKASPFPPR